MKAKTKVVIIGGVVGAALGMAAALLYARSAEDNGARQGQLASPNPSKVLSILLATLGVMRQIAAMGEREG